MGDREQFQMMIGTPSGTIGELSPKFNFKDKVRPNMLVMWCCCCCCCSDLPLDFEALFFSIFTTHKIRQGLPFCSFFLAGGQFAGVRVSLLIARNVAVLLWSFFFAQGELVDLAACVGCPAS
jgi:hypothetical protein